MACNRQQLLSAYISYGLKKFKRGCLNTFMLKNNIDSYQYQIDPPGYNLLDMYILSYNSIIYDYELYDYRSEFSTWCQTYIKTPSGCYKRCNLNDAEYKLPSSALINFNNICLWLYNMESRCISEKCTLDTTHIQDMLLNYEMYDENELWNFLDRVKKDLLEELDDKFSYNFIFLLNDIYYLAFLGDDMYDYISEYVVEIYCEVMSFLEHKLNKKLQSSDVPDYVEDAISYEESYFRK